MVRRVLKELSEMVKGLAVADVVDQAQERIEREESWFVVRSKQQAQNMKGEPDCRKCGETNDRYHLGYAVCTDCVPKS
jgi:hydrogenase maturation factor HypF (carbamoyltransferase family)